ncbi:hypothetical protein AQJ91_35735 [Streptomyces dysideae]|uniref:EthD domain-containing protein n=1 Tax=Streptomyces dysideae TaxID=909626 RepID=A0A124IDW9_9ACTN|nr:hypothetical protein AQJ91_35735 [Streptomyces dysideae]
MKLVILYTKPDDINAFEAHYGNVHIPLVEALPGLQRWNSARVTDAADGGEHTLHRITELHFTDPTSIQAALRSPQGRATGRDFRQIAPPGSRMFTATPGT